jgi:hypothetical protein
LAGWGVIGNDVDFAARIVTYFGSVQEKQEKYVEFYPAAEA